MIHDLKPYSAYKPSEPWLGEVPAHWSLCSLGSLTAAISLRGRPDLPLLSVVREKGVIIRSTMSTEENHNFIPDDLGNYKVVRAGNLVINKMKAWQGSLGVAPVDGIVSPAYFVFDFRIGDRQFGQALLRSRIYVGFFARASDGVRIGQWDLSIDGMKRIPVVVPPLPEQSAIVRFLGYADRRIRSYIRAKKKLIALLNEQKQVIIHRAVTRGLDPHVRLKPSGVEWLGDVPEHWEVLRIKQCSQMISKGTTPLTEGREILESGPVRFLKAENIVGGRVVDSPRYCIDEATHELLRRSQLREGDVLFVIAGATLGKTATTTQEILPANTNQAVAFVRPSRRIVPGYLALWLQSARVRELTWLNAVQSAQPNLSMADLGNFLIPAPPITEQHSILNKVYDFIAGPTQAIERAQREIDLIGEYRTRLIADVVTGKLDVREAAARLPEEAEEAEAVDEAEALEEDGEEAEDTELDGAPEEAVA